MTNTTASALSLQANRLSREKSPYLRQHQHNPVDWYAWGEEAFAKARAEEKLIFLSIGYSTCHWCHVMERESFENTRIAQQLNEHFVSIKVDREERPDVDKIYMSFVQATAGHGGWPLNVFLTPDLKPFFGGTYFRPDISGGRAGFRQVLQEVQQLWQARRADVVSSAADIHARLRQFTEGDDPASGLVLNAEVLRAAGAALKQNYDARHGGFGGAPKFPQPSHPQFLLHCAQRFNDSEARQMVLHTCDRMAAGGIHDQLGGGFARYSVDAEWLVPHFEKMLYDNAQLAQLYLDAYRISGDARHAEVARDILDYVLRDMTHPDGGFYSAEDADSEGQEGKFYCWTRQELAELLAPGELAVVERYFGITEQGNFIDHSHPNPLPNLNVLSNVGAELSAKEQALLSAARSKMLAARARRVRPLRDDKVLASWNGLMLGAMAQAGAVLGDEKYRAAAEKNLAFLQARLWDASSRTLYHRWCDGERDNVQLLEGYAFLLAGIIELYETTLNPAHLELGIALAETMLERFYDAANGGFWQSPAEAANLILRIKEAYDGAEPSGNSVAALALLKLGHITGRKPFIAAAEQTMRLFATRLAQVPQAVPHMLQALELWVEEPRRVVIAGDVTAADTHQLLHAVHAVYQPNKVVLGNLGPVEPFAKTIPTPSAATAYVCTGTACQPPVTDPAAVAALLK